MIRGNFIQRIFFLAIALLVTSFVVIGKGIIIPELRAKKFLCECPFYVSGVINHLMTLFCLW